MLCIKNNNLFRKIVYAAVNVNDKVERVPLSLSLMANLNRIHEESRPKAFIFTLFSI